MAVQETLQIPTGMVPTLMDQTAQREVHHAFQRLIFISGGEGMVPGNGETCSQLVVYDI